MEADDADAWSGPHRGSDFADPAEPPSGDTPGAPMRSGRRSSVARSCSASIAARARVERRAVANLAVPDRDPEGPGDLGDRPFVDVVEDEDRLGPDPATGERPDDDVVGMKIVDPRRRVRVEWALVGDPGVVTDPPRTDLISRSRRRWRRAIRAALATIRFSQPSKAAASRKRGSCRQAATNASWVASAASASFDRIDHASR